MTVMSTPEFRGLSWYAVVVKPGRNADVDRRLRERGYASFLPLCLRERSNGPGRIEEVERPLFDRYQFVGVQDGQAFGPVGSTVDVAFVVRGLDRRPLRVQPFVLERVVERFNDEGLVDLRPRRAANAPRVDWTAGQALEVIDGPFRAFSATLVEWADKRQEMARVLVNIFGRTTPLEAPVSALRPMTEVRAA